MVTYCMNCDELLEEQENYYMVSADHPGMSYGLCFCSLDCFSTYALELYKVKEVNFDEEVRAHKEDIRLHEHGL